MDKILIFGGTTEGRKLAEVLGGEGYSVTLWVATDYGVEVLFREPPFAVEKGRLSPEEMVEVITKNGYTHVIDATHPYATEVTENIAFACQKGSCPYYRLVRKEEVAQGVTYVSTTEEAIAFLEKTAGNILLTTGSKEIEKWRNLSGYETRVFVRVLPDGKTIDQLKEMGFLGKQIIAMQGPFSEQMNQAQLREIHGKYLVTKNAGKIGGFLEKCQGAKNAKAEVIVIGRKKEETGYEYEEMVALFGKENKEKAEKTITLVGIGMGKDTLTEEVKKAVEQADIIIGAKRMVSLFADQGKNCFISHRREEVEQYLEQNPQYRHVLVAFSGDIVFYSGAKAFLDPWKGYRVCCLSGISSLSYFLGKIGISMEEIKVVSLHGTKEKGARYAAAYKNCFFLLGREEDVSTISKELVLMGLGDTEVFVGENLSTPQETITKDLAKNLVDKGFSKLSVAVTIQKTPIGVTPLGIADEAFVRGKVPMTKKEVRILTIANLSIGEKDIVYDIGAGTGSLSIEGAARCPLGKVYAIEEKPQAVALLKENREQFSAWNMEIIEGTAPEVLEPLPPPQKVIIGGSGGKLEEILRKVLGKNPTVSVILNAITLETLAEALRVMKQLKMQEVSYTQVSIANAKEVGSYHMMTSQNPIFLIQGKGGGEG